MAKRSSARKTDGKPNVLFPRTSNQRIARRVIFRAYAPTKALFEKKWVLPDVERVSQPQRVRRVSAKASRSS